MNILASQRFQFKMLSVDGLAWWCFLDNSCGALSLIDWPVPQFCSATSETQAAGPEHEIIDVDNDKVQVVAHSFGAVCRWSKMSYVLL